MAHAGGRPLKFQSVEELEEKIQAYFQSCYDFKRDMWGNRWKDKEYVAPSDGSDDKNPFAGFVVHKVKQFTVSGLAVFLDTYRDVLIDYENGKYDKKEDEDLTPEQAKWNEQVDQFSNTIKRAKQIIYADVEESLFIPGKSVGAIFSLKNNYDWKDRTEIDESKTITHKYEEMSDDELEAAIKARKDRATRDDGRTRPTT